MLKTCVSRIENVLEWDIRKIRAFYYENETEFQNVHHLNFQAYAFFRRSDSTIHVSSKVTRENFDKIFGHEAVHAIFYQKYKGAIPGWLEEGLANYLGRMQSPDYKWLKTQPTTDVTKISHPNFDPTGSRYHYAVSTALIEMIASKCSLKDLLQLSVGSKMETYLKTFCEIKDINSDFEKWVLAKSTEIPGVSSKEIPWWKKPRKPQWWDKKKKESP